MKDSTTVRCRILLTPATCSYECVLVQNELIKDLTSQLAKKEPLLRPGKKWNIGLVSRDEMDQEVGEYKAQVQHFKNELANAMELVKTKDVQIEELKQVGSSLLLTF